MALPSSMTSRRGGLYALSGIELGVFPSTNKTLTIEVQSATANSTSSSVWQSQVFPPTQAADFRFTYLVPYSTRTFYFRARHPAQPGYSAGSFTPTVSAKPTALGEIQRPLMPQLTHLGNVEIPSGSDVYVSSAKNIKVGTQATTGVRSKTLRVGFNQVVPALNTETWDAQNGFLWPNATLVTRTYEGAVLLPKGVVIKSFAARLRRGGSGGAATVFLKTASSAAAVTTLATCTATTVATTSFNTITKTTLNQTVGETETYFTHVQLFSTASAGASRASFLWAEIGYDMPVYEKAI